MKKEAVYLLMGVVGLAAVYFVIKKIKSSPVAYKDNYLWSKPNKLATRLISDITSPSVGNGSSGFDAGKQDNSRDVMNQIETQFA